ncbi:hypothetical protein [Pararhodonellum marinum]|uniref:hypothetical protein n=1 Tax=Pararhodonellum marinum TaxID=2755358 RepID=UPI00188EFB1E|nr:hypothetical protein [Pararhodonellum marinum]
MTRSDFNNQLIDFFEDFGFKYQGKYHQFQKTTGEGIQVILVHLMEYNAASYLEYQLGIRIDRVEKLVHQFLPSMSDYESHSLTLIQTLDKIDGELPRRFLVNDTKETESVMATMEAFFIRSGFRWLDEFSDPVVLERYFNEHPLEKLVNQNYTYKANRGLALAHFFGKRDFLILKRAYLDQLRKLQVTDATIVSFLELSKVLENGLKEG